MGLNEEQAAKKMAEEMEKLNVEMLAAVPGINMTKEQLKDLVRQVPEMIAAAGISVQGMADIIKAGMMGRMSEAQVGEALADMVIGGIYDTMVSPFANQIAEMFNSQILTPMFTAIAAGVPISEAISQASIDAVVQKAQQAAAAINVIMSDPSFKAAIGSIQTAISGIAKASTTTSLATQAATQRASQAAAEKSRRAAEEATRAARQAAEEQQRAAQAAAEEQQRLQESILNQRLGLEATLLQLQGNTAELRRRELKALDPSNRSLQKRIWALQDAKKAEDDRRQAMEQATSSMIDEIRRLRGLQRDESAAALQSQFAILTAQARAGNMAAMNRLPEISRALEQASILQARTAVDVARMRGTLAGSLEQTLGSIGVKVPQFAVGTNYVPNDMLAMVHEGEAIVPKAYNPSANGNDELMRVLIGEVTNLRAEVRAGVTHSAKTAKILERVTPDGNSLAVSDAT
jgi:hypothetical protein